MSPDGRFALVTASQKIDGTKLVPDDVISVVDLTDPAHPRILQTAHAGPGASGISISPNGKLVLVANANDDSISVLSLAARHLTPVGKVQLDPKAGPFDVVFTNDGKRAIALGRTSSKLFVLSVDGTTVTNTGITWAVGRQPYSAAMTHDGKYILNTNLGGALPPPASADAPAAPPAAAIGTPPAPGAPRRPGGGLPRMGTVSMTDLTTGQVVATANVGPTPEHVVLSPDGKYAAVVVINGSSETRTAPNYDTVFSVLEVWAVGDGTLTEVARADAGHWGQGATFSKDGKTILMECAVEREIEVFHFDGTTLVRDKSATIPMVSRPGAIATALSR